MDTNSITIIGRLTRDAETRFSQNNTAVVSFSIAVKKDYKKEGSEASFFDVTLFGKSADKVSQYLRKGTQVCVNGWLEQSRWQDQNGNNRSKVSINTFKVQLLSSPTQYDNHTNNSQQQSAPEQHTQPEKLPDDDIGKQILDGDPIPF